MKHASLKALALLVLLCTSLSVSAENKLGKEITGKLVDAKGKKVSTDFSKKKYIVFYYTASW